MRTIVSPINCGAYIVVPVRLCRGAPQAPDQSEPDWIIDGSMTMGIVLVALFLRPPQRARSAANMISTLAATKLRHHSIIIGIENAFSKIDDVTFLSRQNILVRLIPA